MNKDLTVGRPEAVLWRFCLPLFGSILFQQLYNIADSLVAGKFIGEEALASVGNSYEATLIFLAFAFGCNMGCSVIVSQLFGAKEYGEMKTAVSTACIASAALCAALVAGGTLGCDGLLRLIRTPETAFAGSKLYLDIYIWGLPFVFFYNIATGVMAGYSAAVKLNNLVITSLTTLGNGVSNYTAQNIGAQKLPRVKAGFRAGVKLVWLLSLPLFLLYFLAGRYLLCLFLDDPTEAALQTGVYYLRILSPFYFVVSAKLAADGVLRGSGRMLRFMESTFTDLILRVALAMLLSRTALGSAGIWCAWPIGWSVATAMSIAFYRTGPWRNAADE